jgi:hypothetical protein
MTMKNPRFEDEAVGAWEFPDKNKVKCKDCMLAAKDRKAGGTTISGATLGTCEAFEVKPPSIILRGADCPYYIKKD